MCHLSVCVPFRSSSASYKTIWSGAWTSARTFTRSTWNVFNVNVTLLSSPLVKWTIQIISARSCRPAWRYQIKRRVEQLSSCVTIFDYLQNILVRQLQPRRDGGVFAVSTDTILLHLLSAQRLDHASERVHQEQRTDTTDHANSGSGMKFSCEVRARGSADVIRLTFSSFFSKPILKTIILR